ncbi:hypothetical protein [Marinobacterium rhizophilum]|uniref:DUF1127 domain-containing protein n=1 Tax=Marinobacterium rhizophilum TaxID=420402 RepID=A0ABY5HJN1_9GAMM|nr:hypothetical protein [Marinobacterium rhizophilum]UTW12164.1 hypothetical protein KDW95_00265 [Marinobacterium rhizophilum]
MKLIPGIRQFYRTLRQGCVASASIDRHTLRDIGADPMRLRYPVGKNDHANQAQDAWRQAS